MNHLVISLHGIRTFGAWQERLEQLLVTNSSNPGLTVVNYKFGYFSVVAFIVPFFRWIVVRRFRQFLLEITGASHQWDRIDLVAHSFGTHILAWSIYGMDPSVRPNVNTIILSGSVLKSTFPWQTLLGRSVGRLVNDCGLRDDVLLLSQFAILFTGMAGRLGFNGGTGRSFRNRFFNFSHSGYFITNGSPDDAFMKRYWVPVLLGNSDPELVDLREADALGGIFLMLLNNAEPIKLVIYAAPFVALTIWITSLYLEADRQRAEAQRNFESTSNLLSTFVGAVASTVQPIAKTDTVNELLGKAEDQITQISALRVNDPRIRQQYAFIFLTLAQISWDRGDLQKMGALARRSLGSLDGVTIDITNVQAGYILAAAHRFIGRSKFEANEPVEARIAYETGIKALDKLTDGLPDRQIPTLWLQSLADLQQDLGDVQLDQLNDTNAALVAFQKNFEIRSRLQALQPNSFSRKRDVAWAINKYGDVQVRQGNTASALVSFNQAMAGMEALSSHLWDNFAWPVQLALIENNIGLALTKQKAFSSADGFFQKAEAVLEQTVRLDGSNVARRSALGWTLDNRGESLFRWARGEHDADRLRQSQDILRRALALRSQVARESPMVTLAQAGEINAQRNIALADAAEREWAGEYGQAALLLDTASDLTNKMKAWSIKQYSSRSLNAADIDIRLHTAAMYALARMDSDCRSRFAAAGDLVANSASLFDIDELAAMRGRLRNNPCADQLPPEANAAAKEAQ